MNNEVGLPTSFGQSNQWALAPLQNISNVEGALVMMCFWKESSVSQTERLNITE